MPRSYGNRRKVTDKQIFLMMVRYEGNLSRVARSLKVTPASIYSRMDKNPKLKERFQLYQESLLDAAIDKARELIEEGDRTIILHVLKTLGRTRGLSEKLVIEGGDKPVQIDGNVTHTLEHQYDFSNLTLEERKLLLKAMRKQAQGDLDKISTPTLLQAPQNEEEEGYIDLDDFEVLADTPPPSIVVDPVPSVQPAGLFQL